MPRDLYTLHHLPASGGTVFTKAVAAMNDCVVLSEVHPDRAFWSRMNPLVQITNGYGFLSEAERREMDGLFRKDIDFIYRAAAERGMKLVLRDHAFVDFMATNRLYSRLVEVMSEGYTVHPLVTTRDPVDVWISCDRQNWLGSLRPDSFCFRYRKMLAHFAERPRLCYEDFVADPAAVMQRLCRIMGLGYNPDFKARMAMVRHMTGDSGRSSSDIGPRPRQWEKLKRQDAEDFIRSEQYQALCEETGYAAINKEDLINNI